MRHAKSSWDNLILSDIERPLNARGRASAQALGDWLRAKGLSPDAAFVSNATRTAETWDRLGIAAPMTLRAELYHAGPETLLATLQEATGQTVLILGHNPGIAEFANRIVGTRPDHARFWDYPTGATLVADVPGDWADLTPGTAIARDFVVPRDLIG